MSAVPAPLFVVAWAWANASEVASRHDPGLAQRLMSGLASARQERPVDDLDSIAAFHSMEAGHVEALILRCCSRHIAAAAGPDACIVEIGDAASPHAALLRNATRQMPQATQVGRGRQLLVLPPDSIRDASPNEIVQRLRRIGASHRADPLLVVGAALPPSRHCFAAVESIDVSTSYRYSASRFESLAERAGWQRCQLWSDAQARYAVHVLERNKHVTET